MKLSSARVQHFKSINDSGDVSIDPEVTVLVGQNEAGKTAFLQALYKARPADGGEEYDLEMDYPRRALADYEELHGGNSAVVAKFTYKLEPEEIAAINDDLGCRALTADTFTVTHTYDGTTIGVHAEEQLYVQYVLSGASLPDEVKSTLAGVKSEKELWSTLGETDSRGPEAEALYSSLNARFSKMPRGWQGADHLIWTKHLEPHVPRFIYFDDYRILPGRMNLQALQQRVSAAGTNNASLGPKDLAVLGLFRMAKVSLDELLSATSYESITAKLEATSNKITDRVFKYWKQNDQLDVKIDVRLTPQEPAPYNSGPNLHIRIYNRRHRVTVGFDQRSRGFIWFFSFLVWFDSVKQQLGTDKDLILLLDEPGLSLHALAQNDFLRYIDDLSQKHQTIYTTHSPFMVHGDRLQQVRLVEDKLDLGTTVTDNVMGSDPKTVFPLQAALGYSIAQNLFISKRNLLVEGPTDLVFLQQLSAALEASGRTGLRTDVTVVPAGGLDNVATFVALLGGNKLEMVILHDLGSKPNQRLEQLQREKVIHERLVLNYGLFRSRTDGNPRKRKKGDGDEESLPSTDIEDLFTVEEYLTLFNAAFAEQLKGATVGESDLPPGDRIVDRLGRYLAGEKIQVRPSGGFNHYSVANYAASHPPEAWSEETLDRFETLFMRVNELFGDAD